MVRGCPLPHSDEAAAPDGPGLCLPPLCSAGGLSEGMLVELSNGGLAMVVKLGEEGVLLDANSMLAGKSLTFEVELINIERSV